MEPLLKLRNCYDPNINPQVSLTFSLALRAMHSFMRDKIGTYQERFFTDSQLLRNRGKPSDLDLRDCLDNLDFVSNNTCGITHGGLDTSWNVAGLGPIVNCKMFAPDKDSVGLDLRSFDYQVARECGEPRWTSVLKKIYGISKCQDQYNLKDLITHQAEDRNIIFSRSRGKISEIGYTFAADFEDRQGNPLRPTDSIIIVDQIKRTICGDTFWFENSRLFRDGKTFSSNESSTGLID